MSIRYDKQDLARLNIPHSVCECCKGLFRDHEWVDMTDGQAIDCNFMNHTYYVSYNEIGSVDCRIKTVELLDMVAKYEHNGVLGKGVWEFNREEGGIQARIAPQFSLDGSDNMWHTYQYLFEPEEL